MSYYVSKSESYFESSLRIVRRGWRRMAPRGKKRVRVTFEEQEAGAGRDQRMSLGSNERIRSTIEQLYIPHLSYRHRRLFVRSLHSSQYQVPNTRRDTFTTYPLAQWFARSCLQGHPHGCDRDWSLVDAGNVDRGGAPTGWLPPGEEGKVEGRQGGGRGEWKGEGKGDGCGGRGGRR